MIKKIFLCAVLAGLPGPAFAQKMSTPRKVGIGTASPQGQLHVASDSTTDPFVLVTSHSITGYGLAVSTSGSVGIGTTAPGQLLEVAGKLKLGDDASAPGAGTLKWVGKTLLVYDGALWKSSSGWAFQAVTVGSAYGAAAADSYCRSTYGAEWRLLVPRTAEHLRAAWDFVGGDAGYLTILAIYPRTTGNTCVSTAITSFTCTAWHAYDDGPYWVGTKTTITEPNGDNCPTCSMNYSWNSDGTISAYNDVPAGYTSAKFICMLDHP